MKNHIYAYLITLVLLIIIDGLWLFFFMSKLYQKYLAHLLADTVTMWPVMLFYFFYAFGLHFFVVRHALTQEMSLGATFCSGLLLGLLTYSAYDLTNLATLKNWPIILAVVDMLWGGVLSGITAAASSFIVKRLFQNV